MKNFFVDLFCEYSFLQHPVYISWEQKKKKKDLRGYCWWWLFAMSACLISAPICFFFGPFCLHFPRPRLSHMSCEPPGGSDAPEGLRAFARLPLISPKLIATEGPQRKTTHISVLFPWRTRVVLSPLKAQHFSWMKCNMTVALEVVSPTIPPGPHSPPVFICTTWHSCSFASAPVIPV